MSLNKTISIPRGNDFAVYIPIFLGHPRIRLDLSELTDIQCFVGQGVDQHPKEHTIKRNCIVLCFDEQTPMGIYDFHMKAKHYTRDVAVHEKNVFSVVLWDHSSNFEYFQDGITYIPEGFTFFGICDEHTRALDEAKEKKEAEAKRLASRSDETLPSIDDRLSKIEAKLKDKTYYKVLPMGEGEFTLYLGVANVEGTTVIL